MMKLSFRATILVLAIFAISSASLAAENLFEIIEKTQKSINKKYPDESSIARKMAIEELEKIARSDKSEEERIAAILATFPDPIEEIVRKAEQGDAEAQYKLGNCYCDGKEGSPQDYAEAVKWFRKAAEQGFAEAQNKLGIYYHNGKGITKNYAESVKWFRRAAEQGLATAAINLFICYNEKESFSLFGRNQGRAEAVEFLRRAAEGGDSMAQLELGVLFSLLSLSYVTDETKNVDYSEIPYLSEPVKWFRRAAVQENALAQLSLAACLFCTEFSSVLNDNVMFSDDNTKKFSPEIGQWLSKFIHHEPVELKELFGGLVFEEELRVEDWAVFRYSACMLIQQGINGLDSLFKKNDIKDIHDLASKVTGANDANVEAAFEVLLQKTYGSADVDIIMTQALKIPKILFGFELDLAISEQEETQNVTKLLQGFLEHLGRQTKVLAGLTMLKSAVIPQGPRVFFTIAKNGSGAAFMKWDETNREFMTVGETDETEFPYIVINSPDAAARASKPKETVVFCEDPADFTDGIFFVFGDGSVKFLEGDFETRSKAMQAAIKTFGISGKAATDLLKEAAIIDAIDKSDEAKTDTTTSSLEQQFDSANSYWIECSHSDEEAFEFMKKLLTLAEQGYIPVQ